MKVERNSNALSLSLSHCGESSAVSVRTRHQFPVTTAYTQHTTPLSYTTHTRSPTTTQQCSALSSILSHTRLRPPGGVSLSCDPTTLLETQPRWSCWWLCWLPPASALKDRWFFLFFFLTSSLTFPNSSLPFWGGHGVCGVGPHLLVFFYWGVGGRQKLNAPVLAKSCVRPCRLFYALFHYFVFFF